MFQFRHTEIIVRGIVCHDTPFQILGHDVADKKQIPGIALGRGLFILQIFPIDCLLYRRFDGSALHQGPQSFTRMLFAENTLIQMLCRRMKDRTEHRSIHLFAQGIIGPQSGNGIEIETKRTGDITGKGGR